MDLTEQDIVTAVKDMRQNAGIQFMPTPGTYYDALPGRIQDRTTKADYDVALCNAFGFGGHNACLALKKVTA